MTNERQDDEILGRALARAIETIDVNQTPFERSRLATAPARRSIFGVWQIATAAAAIVLALAIGSWLMRPTESQPGVAASPTAPVAPSSAATPAPGATASPTATSAPTAVDHDKIYLGRPGLPPVAVSGPQFADTVVTADQRIGSRITGLRAYRQSTAPPGLTNYLWNNSFQGGVTVAVSSDLARIDLQLGQPFTASDHSTAFAILQQLVYTATEEPGIRRVLFTQNGGLPLSIGDIKVDKPLAREDVLGYSLPAAVGADKAISQDGAPLTSSTWSTTTETDGTVVRFIFETQSTGGNGGSFPAFDISMAEARDDLQQFGKYALLVVVGAKAPPAQWTFSQPTIDDTTPLRATLASNLPGLSMHWLILDDARPWRVYTQPALGRIVVEVGGDPRTTSDRISVTTPKPGDRVPGGAQFAQSVRIAGAARVFEATVSWRVRDSAGKIVASSHFNASLGSSALWGTFDSGFAVPASVHGNITLEVYEVSPKDGSEQGLVQIPLSVP